MVGWPVAMPDRQPGRALNGPQRVGFGGFGGGPGRNLIGDGSHVQTHTRATRTDGDKRRLCAQQPQNAACTKAR